MKTHRISFAVLVAALFLIAPAAGAQGQGVVPTWADPIEKGCDNLEFCNPIQANQELHGYTPILDTDNLFVRTVLYGHFRDVLQRAPLNTQAPHPQEEPDINAGFLMPTIVTENDDLPCCKFDNNQFLMQSSPGLVEYQTDGEWRTHQEPGLAAEVKIRPIEGNAIFGYWYMSTRALPDTLPGASSAPGVMPAVGVYMQINLGRFVSNDPSRLIAQGDTGMGYKQVPGTDAVTQTVTMIQRPAQGQAGDAVYEFKVPLDLKKRVLPSVHDDSTAHHGFVVQIVPYQLAHSEASFTQAEWRLRTGIDHPPRIVLDVENPMVTTYQHIHTFPAIGYLFFRWSFTSPWGSYDLDPNSLLLTVDGPKNLRAADIEFVILKHGVDHDAHFKPLNATWRYDYVNKPLPPGTYTVNAMVHNLQDTFMLTWQEEFTVNDRGIPQVDAIGSSSSGGGGRGGGASGEAGGGAPGLQVLSLLGAVAAAAVVAQRFRRPE